MSIKELAQKYDEARAAKEAADDAAKDANAALDEASTALADAMIEAELVSFKNDNGVSYGLSVRDYYRPTAENKDALYDVLRSDGLGDIVRETVNANTLSAALRERCEENGGELPAEYDGCVNVFSKTTISRRR